MKIEGSIALVTGANRGLGAAFCRTLLDRGATKVYAAARDLQRSTTTVWCPSSSM
jgi:NAD(P)-dependent dehydrogenase (short-subunit alcohol dehydrogenase family)